MMVLKRPCLRVAIHEASARLGSTIALAVKMLIAACMIWLVYAHAAPSSWWFVARSLTIGDARAGEPVPIFLDRAIVQTVPGQWSVTVLAYREGKTEPQHYCTAYGPARQIYRAGTPPRRDVTLAWLTNDDPDCVLRQPGRYKVAVNWTFFPKEYPAKSVHVESNVFQIH